MNRGSRSSEQSLPPDDASVRHGWRQNRPDTGQANKTKLSMETEANNCCCGKVLVVEGVTVFVKDVEEKKFTDELKSCCPGRLFTLGTLGAWPGRR